MFRYRDRRTGKLRDMGLGSARIVTLAEAREKAAAARSLLASGKDPLDEIRLPCPAIPSFGDFAMELIASLEQGWRNPKHRSQWRSTIGTYCAPISAEPIDQISTDHILDVLKPIWASKAETASRLRGRIEKILDAAKAKGFRQGENPARWRGHLETLLPKRQQLQRGHHAALSWSELPRFIRLLRQNNAMAALALEFTILTAARTGEVLGAKWSEIDLAGRLWTVPGERMKAGRPHRVPLSDRAVSILLEMRGARSGNYIFLGQKAHKPLSGMAMAMLLRRMCIGDVTVHGFRSSFKDWCAEATSFPNELSEAALAHVVGDRVERAYRRGDALDRRRELMEAWAAFLSGCVDGNIAPNFARCS